MEAPRNGIGHRAEWEMNKFRDPTGEIAKFLRDGGSVKEAIERFGGHIGTDRFEGNIGLNEGLQELIDLICGIGTPTKWDNTNARLGVGDDTTAPTATQTGLLAATNKFWKAMDATYPQKSTQTAEWRSTFVTDEANFSWQEYTVVNASDDTGENLNRCVADKGTKSAGETWTLSLKITFS